MNLWNRMTGTAIGIACLFCLVTATLVGCAKKQKVIGAHRTEWKQKELIISYCCSAPPEEAMMKNAAAENFNMIPGWTETLDFAAKHNMTVMLEEGRLTPHIANSPEKLKELEQVIEKVKNHPALGCYYLFDEPKAGDIPAVAKLVSFIRERDPKHFAFVNMLPMYAVPGYAVPYQPGVDPSKIYMDFLTDYIEAVKPDVLSYDYYTFCRKPSGEPEDLLGYFINLALIREAARKANIPFINIIQSCTFEKNWRQPTAEELRWQVYTTLAYGGRGISYFLYWGPKKYGGIYQDGTATQALLEPIVQLNKEMKTLSPILMSLTSTEVFNTEPIPTVSAPIPERSPVKILSPGKFVLGLFARNNNATDHFMLVNIDYRKAADVSFRTPGTSLLEFDLKAAKWQRVLKEPSDSRYRVNLAPGDGRLFRFN